MFGNVLSWVLGDQAELTKKAEPYAGPWCCRCSRPVPDVPLELTRLGYKVCCGPAKCALEEAPAMTS